MSVGFFLLIYSKRQTPLLLDCECFHVPVRPPELEVLGAVMGCSCRCGAPSLLLLAAPCAPALLSTRTALEGFIPALQRCAACQLGVPSIFFVVFGGGLFVCLGFWVCFFFCVSSHALCDKNKSTCWNALLCPRGCGQLCRS